MSGRKCGRVRLSTPSGPNRLGEMASNEPSPRRCPCSQLSSMNLVTEAVSVILWLTKFCFVQGEITTSGSRWLKPQRLLNELSFGPTEKHSGWSVFGSDEPLTMLGATWSYQPSESS